MKHGLLFSCLLLFSISDASAQYSSVENIKGYVLIPKGTIDGKEVKQCYMAATEVSNKQYREFLQALRAAGDTARLRIAMVDTAQWLKAPANPAYADHYFQHKAYDNYPVVNVTRRGALLYCEWLTGQFKKGGKAQMHVTLPDEATWEYAAHGGDAKSTYPWEGNTTKYQKKGKYFGTYLANYYIGLDADKKVDTTKFNPKADVTAPVESYMPNAYGLYNMSGNVAELLSDKSYTKGGSYLSPAGKLPIAEHEDYSPDLGSPKVGFRPIIW